MILERLLGDFPRATFLEECFFRRPFSLPGAAAAFVELATWQTLEAILEQPGADVMVVKQGRRWDGTAAPSPAQARELFETGHTLLVRHAERCDPRLAKLAAAFQNDFAAPVDVHFYCTPRGTHGFGWHYDAEDVFILQTQGVKEYSLRKNTVNPWPLEETLPADMRYEREVSPLMQCRLQAGDWLYVPNGYWHVARTRDEPSFSLAVGVMTAPALEAFDFLRRRLVESMLWRQRLPIAGGAATDGPSERVERYRVLFAELADDLAAALRDEAFVRAYLAEKGIAWEP